MTEDQKLATFIAETQKLDASDPANAQRVADMTSAWMMRAQEPPPLSTTEAGWQQTVQHILQRLDLGYLAETPTQACSQIDAALDTILKAIAESNHVVQAAATRDAIIKQQSDILDAFAAVLHLQQGQLYMDMVPILIALKEKSDAVPLSD